MTLIFLCCRVKYYWALLCVQVQGWNHSVWISFQEQVTPPITTGRLLGIYSSLGIYWSMAFGKNYLVQQQSACIAMVTLPSMTLCRELWIRNKGECTWCVLCQQLQDYQSPSSRRHRPSSNVHRQKSMLETKWEKKLMTFALCLKTNQESIVR